MDKLTYRQLQKHPVLSKAIKVGSSKANYQRTALQDPDGVVREYVVDVNNPKDKQLVGTKGYSPDSYFDPYTGQRVRTAKQPGGGRPAATGSVTKAPSGQAPKGQPQESKGITFQDLNPKQRTKLDDTRKAYDSSADVKKAKEMLSSADGVDEILYLAEQGECLRFHL